MKTKTKILIIAVIVAVVSLTILCSIWDFESAVVRCIFSLIFFFSTLTAGCIACTYEGGQGDDF